MRDDYPKFRAAGTEIVVVTRHSAARMKTFWSEKRLPFLGVPDPDGKITARYRQQWRLFKLGRMPAQFLVDCRGNLAFTHYGSGMSDIPANSRMVARIRNLAPCAAPSKPGAKPPPKK